MLGANGAGKTTTINLILNFIEPNSGQIFVNDIDVTKDPLAAKKHLAAARAAAGSAPPPPAPPVRGARGGGGGRRGQGANQSNPPLSLSTSAPSRAGASWPTAPPTPCSP